MKMPRDLSGADRVAALRRIGYERSTAGVIRHGRRPTPKSEASARRSLTTFSKEACKLSPAQ